jgi:hypothetical protein
MPTAQRPPIASDALGFGALAVVRTTDALSGTGGMGPTAPLIHGAPLSAAACCLVAAGASGAFVALPAMAAYGGAT